LVFVGLSTQKRIGNKTVYEPTKIWWLRLSEQGDSIVAARRLTEPIRAETERDQTAERCPYVAVGAGGRMSLLYLTRRFGHGSWTLDWAAFELDRQTGDPIVSTVPEGRHTLGAGLAAVPLVGAADGHSVYAVASSGQIVKHAVPVRR
jgi:hypothetical protein